MLIYFRNDHHFVVTTYILDLYDKNQADFKGYPYIRTTYTWKSLYVILYWARCMISPFPYIEHANFRLLICLFHFNNNESDPNFLLTLGNYFYTTTFALISCYPYLASKWHWHAIIIQLQLITP